MEEHLEQSDLQGVSGWLVLPCFMLLKSVFAHVYTIAETLGIFKAHTIHVSISSGHLAYQQPITSINIIEFILNLGLLIFEGLIFYSLLKKKRILPRLMIVWLVVLLVTTTAGSLISNAIIASINKSDYAAVVFASNGSSDPLSNPIVRALISCAIWIPYFVASKRVKATFVN
jgi:hypothetical protein